MIASVCYTAIGKTRVRESVCKSLLCSMYRQGWAKETTKHQTREVDDNWHYDDRMWRKRSRVLILHLQRRTWGVIMQITAQPTLLSLDLETS